MVDMVLATDMAIHFDLLKRFNTQLDDQPDMSQWAEPNLAYQMLLHLADIANPSRPFHLARGWAERVIQEFCEQVGTREY
jgi:cAMP-specific phosphodiesterase 4